MGRAFSTHQKRALRVDSGREGEADHVVPYSRGGKTDVVNGQILSRAENRRKGATHFEPRPWQKEMLKSWNNRAVDCKGYLAVCAPGSGKTTAALMIARQWLNAKRDRQLVVVVPSKNLQLSWRNIASQLFQINLETEDCGSSRQGFHGSVTTYQGVSSADQLLRIRVSRSETMVIFDEVHHCSDRNDWGEKINNAFGYAKEVLMLSGTPWRTDKQPISFATYGPDGLVKADFSFTYPEARRAGHIRRPSFSFEAGKVTEVIQDRSYLVSLDLPEDEQTDITLTPLVATDDSYMRRLIEKGHNALQLIRRQRPKAGGIIMCVNIPHAHKVAGIVKDITGYEAALICSDPDIENTTVDRFRLSDNPWVVTVKKVSEGTDIPRLEVLVWLTNIVSGTFFHQAVGRVIRKQGNGDDEAQIILPASSTYRQLADNMENEFGPAIDVDEFDFEDWGPPREPIEPRSNSVIYRTEYLGTEMVSIAGISVSPSTYEKAVEMSRIGNVPVEALLRLMTEQDPSLIITGDQIERAPDGAHGITLEDQLKQLRLTINQQVNALARRIMERIEPDKDLGWHLFRIHTYIGNGVKQDQMSKLQLERKLQDAMYFHENPQAWRIIYEKR